MPAGREHLILDVRDRSEPLPRLREVLAAVGSGPLVVVMRQDPGVLDGLAALGVSWRMEPSGIGDGFVALIARLS